MISWLTHCRISLNNLFSVILMKLNITYRLNIEDFSLILLPFKLCHVVMVSYIIILQSLDKTLSS